MEFSSVDKHIKAAVKIAIKDDGHEDKIKTTHLWNAVQNLCDALDCK